MKFRIIDILWLVAVCGCLLGWHVDRLRQSRKLDRAVELMRIYKDACVFNDEMYRREAAEVDRQFRNLRRAFEECRGAKGQ